MAQPETGPKTGQHPISCDRATEDLERHGENTLLLPTDLPVELIPDKSVRFLVSIVGGLCLVLVGVSAKLFGPALQEIMEDVICRSIYNDHQLDLLSPEDKRCKDNDVQKTLAMVSAWDISGEMVVREYHADAIKSSQTLIFFQQS